MQQEPRILSNFSHDENMMNAYREGKDLYATIATRINHNNYWDNMEKHQDGTPNPDGKKRRSKVKSLLLGIMYGMGAASLAEAIGGTVQEAQKIIDDFYKGFPEVKRWIDKTDYDAKKFGYVEDFWGRRRRLPDIQLPEFDIKDRSQSEHSINVNPLLGSKGLVSKTENPLIDVFRKKLAEAKGNKQVEKIKEEALAKGIVIHNNGGKIAYAERQCVNARIQGSAATMSKLAMRKVYDDPELRNLGFRMLLQVHDELIGECPEENAEKAADRLSEVMKHAAEPDVIVPFKCDTYVVPCWYYDDFGDVLQQTFRNRLEKEKKPEDEVFKEMLKEHEELTENQLKDLLSLNV